MSDTAQALGNPLLDVYREQARHQDEHCWGRRGLLNGKPSDTCLQCLIEKRLPGSRKTGPRFEYGFAIPTDEALATIAAVSPYGVTEIGSGKGYWARLLRDRGVDVDATDVDPSGGQGDRGWFVGEPFTAIRQADAVTAARAADPARTLLMVWPCYSEGWAAEAVEAFRGDTVVYVGEGYGGCTGDGRLHRLLGMDTYCWHGDDEDECVCSTTPLFHEVETAGVPQWSGLHDRLSVHRRLP